MKEEGCDAGIDRTGIPWLATPFIRGFCVETC